MAEYQPTFTIIKRVFILEFVKRPVSISKASEGGSASFFHRRVQLLWRDEVGQLRYLLFSILFRATD